MALTRLPNLDGVSVERADAAWVTCDTCEEQELIYGPVLRGAIKAWRDAHYHEEHDV